MTREEYFDNEGRIHVNRARKQKWGDTKTAIDIGLTRTIFEDAKRSILDEVQSWAPWFDTDYLTIVRRADVGVDVLATKHFNCRRWHGWSDCHYSTISSEPQITDNNSANKWDLDVGEPFIPRDDNWQTGYRGDDSPMGNWPKNTKSVSVNGIHHGMAKDGILAHSRYTNLTTLISGLGCHSDHVRQETVYQMHQLYAKRSVVIWSFEHCCWICMPHEYKVCCDWPFETAIAGLMGHSGCNPIHGISQIVKGECVAIPYDESVLRDIFKQDISPQNYDIDYDQWRRERKTGVVLTNTAILREHQKIAKTKYLEILEKAYQNGTQAKFEKKEYRQKVRRRIAKEESIYVVDDSIYSWAYNLTTDFFHCFDCYVNIQLKTLIVETHCCYCWSSQQVQGIVQAMSLVVGVYIPLLCICWFVVACVDIPFVNQSISKQLNKNKSGNINVPFHFTSNGAGYKKICSRLNFAFNEASWIAHEDLVNKLSDLAIEDIIDTPLSQLNIDMSLLVPTMKLAIKYSAHKWMRRGWAGFWASKYTKTPYGVVPRELVDAKHYWRKGFNMLQCCAPEMVSFVLVLVTFITFVMFMTLYVIDFTLYVAYGYEWY